MGNIEKLGRDLSSATEQLRNAATEQVDARLNDLKSVLETITPGEHASLKAQIDSAATEVDKYIASLTSGEKAKEVKAVITSIHSQLTALRSSIVVPAAITTAAAPEKKNTIMEFFSGFGDMIEKFRTKASFSGMAEAATAATDAGIVEKKSSISAFFSFFFQGSNERNLLAKSLTDKGVTSITVEKGGRFDALKRVAKAKYADMELPEFFAKVADRVKGKGTVTYAELVAAANRLGAAPAPQPKPQTAPEEVSTPAPEFAAKPSGTDLLDTSAPVIVDGSTLTANADAAQFTSQKDGENLKKFQLSGDDMPDLKIASAKLNDGAMDLVLSSDQGNIEGQLSQEFVTRLASASLEDADKTIALTRGGLPIQLKVEALTQLI